MNNKKLYRSEADLIFGGVAGGLGKYFDLDSALIRIIFIALTLAGGSGIILYLLLWLLLPTKSNLGQGSITKESLEKNARDIEEKAKATVKKLQNSTEIASKENSLQNNHHRRSYWLGFGLIMIGSLLILQNLNIISRGMFWPLILVLTGVAIIIR